MRFSTKFHRSRTLLKTHPGEFDGVPPVPHLEVGLNLRAVINADRLAVGLALVYSPWLAGPMHTPDPVSALTAQRVAEFFDERFVTVTTVTDLARPIPRGVDDVTVAQSARTPLDGSVEPCINLAPLSHGEGSALSGRQMTVPSNVHLFSGPAGGHWPSDLHTLGLAVILAQHADANILKHPAARAELPAVALLLEAVGLGLVAP